MNNLGERFRTGDASGGRLTPAQMAAQQGRGVQNITAWAESGQAFPGAKG